MLLWIDHLSRIVLVCIEIFKVLSPYFLVINKNNPYFLEINKNNSKIIRRRHIIVYYQQYAKRMKL